MTTSTIPLTAGSAATRTKRLIVALGIVVLIAVSFVVGHLTVGSQPVPVPVQIHAQGSGAYDAPQLCQVGNLRGPC
jgi:hypothetical protein